LKKVIGLFILAMMPVQGGTPSENSLSEAATMLCILLSTHAFAKVSRLGENWQLGGIFSYGSGAPLRITASTLPVPLRDFPKSSGKVTFDSTGALYFEGPKHFPIQGRLSCVPTLGWKQLFHNTGLNF
jgi:hypothetical protein